MSNTNSKLKSLQADSLVLFTKIHNYHWNIKGINFMPIHKYTEELYDEVNEIYDWLAERLIQKGDIPYVTLKDSLANAIIKEDSNTNFDEKYVLSKILEDLNYLLKTFRELSEISDDEDDTTTEMYADDQVAKLEKRIWILSAMQK